MEAAGDKTDVITAKNFMSSTDDAADTYIKSLFFIGKFCARTIN